MDEYQEAKVEPCQNICNAYWHKEKSACSEGQIGCWRLIEHVSTTKDRQPTVQHIDFRVSKAPQQIICYQANDATPQNVPNTL